MRKHSVMLLFVSLLSTYSFAQSKDEVDGTSISIIYQFFNDAVLTEVQNALGEGGGGKVNMEVGVSRYNKFRFRRVKTLEDNKGIVIRFLSFPDSTLKAKYNVFPDGSTKYFIVFSKDFEETSEKRYSVGFLRNGGTAVTGGITLLPIKFRPQVDYNGKQKNGFEFSKDVSLGLSIGLKQRISATKPFFANLLFSPGIGNITLDSFNTKGVVSSRRDVPGLTISLGLVLDYKIIQFGTFPGWDRISDRDRSNWIY